MLSGAYDPIFVPELALQVLLSVILGGATVATLYLGDIDQIGESSTEAFR